MSVNVIASANFKREAKRLIKKYKSLKSEISDLIDHLEETPFQGKLIAENIYKIRLSVKSKGKGKSGGLRVITYAHMRESENGDILVFLLSIYDKSEMQNISDNFIKDLILEMLQTMNDDNSEIGHEDE